MKSKYVNHLSRKHQIVRMLWLLTWTIGARWMPRSVGAGWKRFLLRLFGAKIASSSMVYSSARIYYPANLFMDQFSCIASDVDCYNVAPIHIGRYSTVSQGAMLCTASHNIESPNHELVIEPIEIGDEAWIGARAYIGMGVKIGKGSVVGATASVYKSIGENEIVGGNPAKFIKKRVIKD